MAKSSPTPEFLITDPLAQPGVVATKPEGAEILDLDDVPYRAEPQIRCAFCQHRQWHNDGYFAILSNGQRAPCGNCCAAKFDAVKKRTIDRNRTRLKRDRDNRERARALASDVDDLADIAALADSTVCATATALYVLPQVLTAAAREDMANHGVRGLSFLGGCSARLDLIRSTIRVIRRLDRITEKEHGRYAAIKREAINEARIAVAFMKACADFFDDSNLTAAEEWAQSRGRQFRLREFKVKKNALHAKGPELWQNIDLPNISLSPVVLAFSERIGEEED